MLIPWGCSIVSTVYKQVYAENMLQSCYNPVEMAKNGPKLPNMAKNGQKWPKMMEDDPSGWNKWLPDHPYTIPNEFTIEYKQVYAENPVKIC